MDPLEFLRLAEELAKVDQPAELRTAVGRAYYAVYNYGVDFQKKNGFRFYRSGRDHVLVRDRFGSIKSSGIKNLSRDLKELSKDIRNLHKMRKSADYNLSEKRGENFKTVQIYIVLAKNIVSAIGSVQNHPEKKGIIQAMHNWDRANLKRPP